MLSKNVVLNKFYKYAGTIVKVKKLSKSRNKIVVERLDNGEQVLIPYQQNELLLSRIYTVGEVAKIVERRSDTLRKYEKKGLIASPSKFGDRYNGYKNWRYYEENDVYEMVEFFNTRVPGRPVKEENVSSKIKTLSQKVKLTFEGQK